jgi:hypothetical protein
MLQLRVTARLYSPRKIKDRAHTLTSRPKASVAHLMNGDEVFALAVGGLSEELECLSPA